MMKFNDFIVGFYRIMLLIFGVFEIALIWAMSMFFICYISSDTNEVTFFCKDHYILNIIVVIAFVAILFVLKKKKVISSFVEKLDDDEFYNKTKSVMLKIIALIAFIWVVITQYVPGSDQLDVLSSAYKYGVNDTSVIEAGGYLDKWLHNVGITTVERILGAVVGDFNIIFMQLLNIPGIVLIYKKIVDIWDKEGGSRLSQVCTLVAGIIFYPLIMYASFVYGNIWSVTLSLLAFDAEMDYFDSKKKSCILKFALAVGLSYIVKSSAIIFMVAFGIYAIVRGAMEKTKLYHILILLLAMCVSYAFFSIVPKIALSKSMGRELRDSDGIWAFIAMGLQEDGTTAGWYNNYCLDVYYDNNRDSEVAEKIAREEVFNRIDFFLSDKHNGFEFFSKKIASSWIEPTYQGYWVNQVRAHRVVFPAWLDSFMSAKGYATAAKIFNFFQILVFFGTVLWLILEDKKAFVAKSFFLLSVVGGFTFLLFWETKSQYTITYFILLFPYAAYGYELLLSKAKGVVKESNKPILIYTALTVVCFLVGYTLDASYCLSNNNDAYAIYLDNYVQPGMTESVNEINHLRTDLDAANQQNAFHIEQVEELQEREEYYQKLLEENGIEY